MQQTEASGWFACSSAVPQTWRRSRPTGRLCRLSWTQWAEPAAAAELVQRCARLPLTLRVAAQVTVAHPTESLTSLVAELGRYRLDVLAAGGDEHADVRAVFSWSY